jgi:hypothetical protein
MFLTYKILNLNFTFQFSAKFNLNYIRHNPYREVNTLCLGYEKTNKLNLYREIIAVCFVIHTKHANALCGQNADCCLLNWWYKVTIKVEAEELSL